MKATQLHLDNLKIIEGIIVRKIDTKEPETVQNLIVNLCGTFGCILGDFIIHKLGVADTHGHYYFKEDTPHGKLYEECVDGYFTVRPKHFGYHLTGHFMVDVFKGSFYGSLQDRLEWTRESIVLTEEALRKGI